jgi:hypothetical protein
MAVAFCRQALLVFFCFGAQLRDVTEFVYSMPMVVRLGIFEREFFAADEAEMRIIRIGWHNQPPKPEATKDRMNFVNMAHFGAYDFFASNVNWFHKLELNYICSYSVRCRFFRCTPKSLEFCLKMNPTSSGSSRFCWICGKVVSLESAKTDHHGNAVHELCYVAKIRAENESLKLKPKRPFDHET